VIRSPSLKMMAWGYGGVSYMVIMLCYSNLTVYQITKEVVIIF